MYCQRVITSFVTTIKQTQNDVSDFHHIPQTRKVTKCQNLVNTSFIVWCCRHPLKSTQRAKSFRMCCMLVVTTTSSISNKTSQPTAILFCASEKQIWFHWEHCDNWVLVFDILLRGILLICFPKRTKPNYLAFSFVSFCWSLRVKHFFFYSNDLGWTG